MFIGKLNDKIAALEWQAVRSDNGNAPKFKESGDPFSGERLAIAWSELAPSGLDLQIRIPEGLWLDSIVLHFGAKSEPVCVSLFTADKERLVDSYHSETGKAISQKEIALHAEGEYESVILSINAELSDVILEGIELYGADFSGEQLYPTPAKFDLTSAERLPIADYNTVSADCAEAENAIAILEEKLYETVSLSVSRADDGNIAFIHRADIAANGYTLTADAERITIEASDLRGFVQGAETLIKLIDASSIPNCRIEDAPFCEFRGVHLFVPAPDRMDYTKRLIKYLLSPMGYNHIIMELAGAMRYHSHPEINEAFLEGNRRADAGEWPPFPHGSVGGKQIVEHEDIRDLIDYARSFGIEIIPEIQSLGHVQFMTLAHPDIAERPVDAPVFEAVDERFADIPPKDFYAHCFCPSNPKSYEILFDLMDEIIEVFKPKKYVHMGHDEIYQIGVCPVCSKRDPADILAEDLCRLHDYLAERGLSMMIWSDMLQPVTKYKTPSAISRIPKDIVMLDFIWYFHVDKDIEDNLLREGFEVIMGNMYSSHYPRYESRIRKAGMRGAQVSSWVQTDEETLAREGKLYDFLYSAQMMWSDSYTRHARYAYDKIISGILPQLREHLKQVRYPSLAPHNETILYDGGAIGETFDLNGRFDSLLIEHTALRERHRVPWKPLEVIGNYVITYESGAEKILPVTYAGNIGHCKRRHHQPFTHQYYRHNGYITAWETDGIEKYDENGERITLYQIEWINPRPEEVIANVAYRPVDDASDLYVGRIVGVKK